MLTELRKVPGHVAAVVVLGAAVATVGLLTAFQSIFASDGNPRPPRTEPEIVLGAEPYPSEHGTRDDDGVRRERRRLTPTRRLIGQRLMAPMAGIEPSPGLIAAVRRGHIGGVVLFPPAGTSGARLERGVARLQAAARDGDQPGLLVAVDQEGGPVKRLSAGPPTRGPTEIGRTGNASIADREGRLTGRYLSRLRINVNLAPVVDVPPASGSFLSNRTFSADPNVVARLGAAFADGLRTEGVAATLKHFPGLGRATTNTDRIATIVGASRETLESDLTPFREGVAAGAELVMTSTAVYPAYGSRLPASLSPQVIENQLRRRLGFGGVVITDDLETPAIRAALSAGSAAVAAVRAGADIALFARTERGAKAAYVELLTAVRRGDIDRKQLEAPYRRILSLKQQLATQDARSAGP